MTSLLFLTQKTTYKRQSVYYIIYLKDTIWKLLHKRKVFVSFGADHLRTKFIINDETLEQVSQFTYLGCSISYQFTYLGCSISYQFFNDVEFKLTKFLQLIRTIERTSFKKVRKKTVLKIYKTLVLPIFLYGSENWTLIALQRRRIEAAEMKLLRPLAGYTLYDHKTNDYIRREHGLKAH